ncbi:uncharacterized protein LOC135164211 isoform X2 [Diachasmimorpha longicaudata]|uniref:uncharacterized protein LOC135164211 isoform X2 n=1 Tax=Diachasmimorpha longicaudata TaxID=58733 RepID=UPI0030B86D90
MPKVCAVPNCGTGTKVVEEKRSLFRVPSDEEQRKKWEAAIPGMGQLKSSQSICERHFLKEEVHKKWIKYDDKGHVIAQYDYPRPRLEAKAIPCIFTDEESIGPSDPWSLYERLTYGTVGATVLRNSNKNPVGRNETKRDTIQEVYFTGEHSYCRPQFDRDATDNTLDSRQNANLQNTENRKETAPTSEQSKNEVINPSQNPLQTDSVTTCDVAKAETVTPEIKNIYTVAQKKKGKPLKFDLGGVFESGNKLVRLPYMWCLSEVITQEGKQIIFSHVILASHNNVEAPVLKHSVVINDRSGNIDYYAHGKLVDISNTKLPRKVEDIVSLQITLYTFQKMRVCGGITRLIKSREPGNKDIYQDLLQSWRHNDCKILVDRGKCELCSKMQKIFVQQRRRAKKSSSSLRISTSWDPKDQVAVLKKKLAMEKRKRIHAQAQARKLTGASKENGVQVPFVKDIPL